MGLIILLIMIAVPIGEIAVFIQAGELIGLWPTLGTVIVTAVAGTALLRHQGFDTLRRIQESAGRGEAPVRELFDGFCLLIAGALLLTPGFITDGVGFLLFLPPFRRLLGGAALRWMMRNATVYTAQTGPRSGPGTGPRTGGDGGPIIDGEFEDLTGDRGGGAAPPGRDAIGRREPGDDRRG
ncbi:MAG: FxsA family protein [Rhodospirillales bacterium]